MAGTTTRKRSRTQHKIANNSVDTKRPKLLSGARSLLDISAKLVAEKFPYQVVEERLGNVPEPVQKRIVFWAFPGDESSIRLYSSSSICTLANEQSKQPYQSGLKILAQGGVSNVLQIGFHVSGIVKETVGICHQKKILTYNVSITFDRGCITSATCACDNRSILWCAHVVALTLYRIRHADNIPIKAPISDSIIQLEKSQLQKLLLHLIAGHHNSILPAVQQLVDDLSRPNSQLSTMHGIPDPTAGACSDTMTSWYIDVDVIRQEVKTGLLAGSTGRNITTMFNKVREMVSARDSNYINLLIAITDAIISEFAESPNHHHNTRARKQCDALVALWLSVVSSDNMPEEDRLLLQERVSEWNRMVHCPKENVDDHSCSRSIFAIVEEACQCPGAKSSDNIVLQAGYIDWLCLCGQEEKAKDIAAKALATLKSLSTSSSTILSSKGGLFALPTEPIFTLFNCLLDSGLESAAVEVALLGLSYVYTLPVGQYSQARLLHRVEQLLTQLDCLNISKKPALLELLYKYAKTLHTTWSAQVNEGRDILPAHGFMRFLFENLLVIDRDFAFKLASFVLPLNISRNSDQTSDDGNNHDDVLFIDGVECLTGQQLELQQAELAAVMLRNSSTHHSHLRRTLDGILEEINRPSHLQRLARLCQSMTSWQTGVFLRNLREVAFELGVRTVRLLADPIERKDCIRWLVSCAVDTGKHAVEFLIRNWSDLFLPKEITCDVARMLTSQPVIFHLNLPADENLELMNKIRSMVIEASIRDPASCVMFALTVCEEHAENFDLLCHIVMQSSNRLHAAQLFSIARYLDSKQYSDRAFKIGMLAVKQLDIGPADDKHPAVCDLLWVCTLASNLGRDELTQVIPVIVNCVHNPMLLTEIGRRCSSPVFNKSNNKFSCNKEPLNRLVAAAQRLFVQDIEQQLQTITPKSYTDFTKNLQKIQSAFSLTEDGVEQFEVLLDYILTSQKGKKKLQKLVQHVVFAQSSAS